MTQASRSIVIDVDPLSLYNIIVDFEKYPEFISEVKDVAIESAGENEWTVTFSISLIKRIEYTLHLKGDPGKGVVWNLARKGFMKKNDGSWKLEPQGEGKVKATYSAELDLGLLAPKSIVNMLVSTNFPAMLEAFKKRAESRK